MPEETVSIVGVFRDRISPAIQKTGTAVNNFAATVGRSIGGIASKASLLLGSIGAGALAARGLQAAKDRSIAESRVLAALAGQRSALEEIKSTIASIPKIPGFDDVTLTNQAANMLTLGVSVDKVNRSLRASVDVSAALGVPLDSALELLRAIETGSNNALIGRIPELRQLREEGRLAAEGLATVERLFAGRGAALSGNIFAKIESATSRLNDELGNLGDKLAPLQLRSIEIFEQIVRGATRLVDTLDGGDDITLFDRLVAKAEESAASIRILETETDSLRLAIEQTRDVGEALDLSKALRTLDPAELSRIIARIEPELADPIRDVFASQIERAVKGDVIEATRALELERALGADTLRDQLDTLTLQAGQLQEAADWADVMAAATLREARARQESGASVEDTVAAMQRATEYMREQKEAQQELQRVESTRAELQVRIAAANAKLADSQDRLAESIADRAKDARDELTDRLSELESLVESGALSPGEGIVKQQAAVADFNRKLDETIARLRAMYDASNQTADGVGNILREVEKLRDGVKLLTDESNDLWGGFLEGIRQGGENLDTLRELGIEVGRTLSDALADGAVDVFVRGKTTVREWAAEVLASIAAVLVKFAVLRAVQSTIGTLFPADGGTSTTTTTGGGENPSGTTQQGGGGGGGGAGGAAGSTTAAVAASTVGTMNVTAATVNVTGGGPGGATTPGTGTTGTTGTTGSNPLSFLGDLAGDLFGFGRGTLGEGVTGAGDLLSLAATGLGAVPGFGAAGPLSFLPLLLGQGGGGLGALGGLIGGGNSGLFSLVSSLFSAASPAGGATGSAGVLGMLGPMLTGGFGALTTAGPGFASLLPMLLEFLPGLAGGAGGILAGLSGGIGFESLLSFLPLLFLSEGGGVPGPTKGHDYIPAALDGGEFVLNPRATNLYAASVDALNRMQVPAGALAQLHKPASFTHVGTRLANGGEARGARSRGGGSIIAHVPANAQTAERLDRGGGSEQRKRQMNDTPGDYQFALRHNRGGRK